MYFTEYSPWNFLKKKLGIKTLTEFNFLQFYELYISFDLIWTISDLNYLFCCTYISMILDYFN